MKFTSCSSAPRGPYSPGDEGGAGKASLLQPHTDGLPVEKVTLVINDTANALFFLCFAPIPVMARMLPEKKVKLQGAL